MKLTTKERKGSGGSGTAKNDCRSKALSLQNIKLFPMQNHYRNDKPIAHPESFNIHRGLVKQNFKKDRSKLYLLGQSLVEFALVLPILVLIIYGIFDLGRAFYVLVTISNASREGARYMTTHITVMDPSINNSLQLVKEQVKAEALGSGVTLTDSNIYVYCTPELDTSGASTPNCAHGQDALVRVSYTFRPLFSSIFPASIPINWETRMIVP